MIENESKRRTINNIKRLLKVLNEIAPELRKFPGFKHIFKKDTRQLERLRKKLKQKRS